MAVAYVDVSLATSASHNSSISVTVPAGATFALICFGGYNWADGGADSSCSLAGQSGVFVANAGAASGADELSMIFRVSGFATGSQTLAWVLNGTRDDGLQIAVLYFSGVDGASPIRSSGTSLDASISLALSSVADDMGVLFISDYKYDPDSSGADQTVRVNTGVYNNNYLDAATEPATTTTTTLTGAGGGDHSAIGVVLAAAGAGGLSIPVAMASYRRRRP